MIRLTRVSGYGIIFNFCLYKQDQIQPPVFIGKVFDYVCLLHYNIRYFFIYWKDL